MENTHNFLIPTTNLIGVGAIKDLPTQLMPYKLSKALIVTDKNIIRYGYVEMVETILKSLFISYDIFDGVLHPNCTISFVEDGLSYFNKGINLLKRDYNFVISIGGGTNHDCAKSIAVVATNGGSIADYEGYNKMTKLALPIVTINTTAGSGAELSNFVIITDESRKSKLTIGDAKMQPSISVNDPLFMPTIPQEVTAGSGYDVISHGIESFISTEASPITDSVALSAIKLASKYLKRAYDNGNDMEAREQMMYANIMAGMAFNNGGLGYVHSIAHQLGGYYNQIHGFYNSVLLPYVLEYNAVSIPDERILMICEALGEKAESKLNAVDKIVSRLQRLSLDIKLPIHLKEMEIDDSNFEYLSNNALKDLTALTNPRKGTFEDIMGILKAAY